MVSIFTIKILMYVKKAERWRIDAFELWCGRRLLRVPWTARGSKKQGEQPSQSKGNPSWILTESSDAEAEAPVLWLCDAKSQLIGKTLMLGKIEGRRRRGRQRMRWLDASPTQWTWIWVNSGNWWWTGRPGVLRFMGSQRVGHNWATELNWTELKYS